MARYRNAWKCHKCPESAGEQGCPAWAEYVERDAESGQDRVTKECVFQALPKFLIYAVAAATQASASIDAHRNEIVSTLAQAAEVYLKAGGPSRLAAALGAAALPAPGAAPPASEAPPALEAPLRPEAPPAADAPF